MPDGSFTMAQGALSSKAILGAGIPKGRSHGPFAVKVGSGFRVEMLEQRSCLISRGRDDEEPAGPCRLITSNLRTLLLTNDHSKSGRL